jgi:hypothetical protein
VYTIFMNLKAFLLLVAVLAVLTWFLGNGIESVQEENAPEEQGVLGNTLDAAKGAASQLGN